MAPIARLDSRKWFGTAFIASSEILTTMGRTMTDITIIALIALKYPAPKVSLKIGLININAKKP